MGSAACLISSRSAVERERGPNRRSCNTSKSRPTDVLALFLFFPLLISPFSVFPRRALYSLTFHFDFSLSHICLLFLLQLRRRGHVRPTLDPTNYNLSTMKYLALVSSAAYLLTSVSASAAPHPHPHLNSSRPALHHYTPHHEPSVPVPRARHGHGHRHNGTVTKHEKREEEDGQDAPAFADWIGGVCAEIGQHQTAIRPSWFLLLSRLLD